MVIVEYGFVFVFVWLFEVVWDLNLIVFVFKLIFVDFIDVFGLMFFGFVVKGVLFWRWSLILIDCGSEGWKDDVLMLVGSICEFCVGLCLIFVFGWCMMGVW